MYRAEARSEVIKALEEFGGSIKDSYGGATTILAEHLNKQQTALNVLLSNMERDGEIVREMNARRTFYIGLPKAKEVDALITTENIEVIEIPEPVPLTRAQELEQLVWSLRKENHNLRLKMERLQDELVAGRSVREGLRKTINTLQANLDSLRDKNKMRTNDEIKEEITNRSLARIMASRPERPR